MSNELIVNFLIKLDLCEVCIFLLGEGVSLFVSVGIFVTFDQIVEREISQKTFLVPVKIKM